MAFVPALVAGALLVDFVKRVLYDSLAVIAVAFIVGGIVMLIVERVRPAPDVLDADQHAARRARSASALCQALALIPGVSRSGATIVGGDAAGLDRPAAAEFSFFLAMPTMAAAFAHDLLEVRHQLATERGAGDRGRLRDGVHRVAARRQAVPAASSGARASRRSRGIASSLGVGAARGDRGRVGVAR